MNFVRLATAAAFAVVACTAARANDSSVELAVGGLTFSKTDAVAMESEDLSISPAGIVVKYRFVNRSSAPVTLTIGFPLPEIDLSDPDTNYAIPTGRTDNMVGFKTEVDGKAVPFQVSQQAFLGKQDVTAAVKAAGLPVFPPFGSDLVAKLDPAARDKLLEAGLLVPAAPEPDGKPQYQPAWSVRTTFVRRQTFQPGVPVAVTHRYRASIGLSMDTVLRKPLRQSAGLRKELEKYTSDYCITPGFLGSVDAFAGVDEANVHNVREQRIAYVLKTGANWATPIRNFRLTVSAGGPGRLMAFCAEGETRLNGPAVEVRATDFTPKRDLKVLILSKAK